MATVTSARDLAFTYFFAVTSFFVAIIQTETSDGLQSARTRIPRDLRENSQQSRAPKPTLADSRFAQSNDSGIL